MAVLNYDTVAESSEIEIVIQKSRFIGRCFPIETEQAALDHLERIRKQHWDASHNCYAYAIGENAQIARCSDDGEPGGTAGMPMMHVLQKRHLRNVLVVVTRYFGGTLLGAGGLVRAYSKTASEACKAACPIQMRWSTTMQLEMDYALWGKMQRFLHEYGVIQEAVDFAQQVTANVLMPAEQVAHFTQAVIEATDGRIQPRPLGECYYAWPVTENEET